jgi:hypothetical protein
MSSTVRISCQTACTAFAPASASPPSLAEATRKGPSLAARYSSKANMLDVFVDVGKVEDGEVDDTGDAVIVEADFLDTNTNHSALQSIREKLTN